MKKLLSFLTILFLVNQVNAQQVSVPAYTGYATPAEKNNEDGESTMFTLANGLHNWTSLKQQVHFYFRIRTTGSIDISMMAKADAAGNKCKVSIAGKDFTVSFPVSKDFRAVKIGTVEIKDSGSYELLFTPISKQSQSLATINSIELNGPATANMHFNSTPRRNAASVHLFYPAADSLRALSFYNEITVPKNSDQLYSYFMACGFARGYFGIQVNSPTERRVIFSIWDAGNEQSDRDRVSAENKVQLIAKGEDVISNSFGDEGTGGHSHWNYNWKAGETYKFLVTAVVDTVAVTTTYAAYFFLPETQKWKFIACFKAPKDAKQLNHLYSFIEDFEGNNGQLNRSAYFGNQWVRKENGEWKEITDARFSIDAEAKAGNRIDYGGGAESNQFYLWQGGYGTANAKFGDEFRRTASGTKPVIDLYRNEDSLVESNREHLKIIEAINKGTIDTTGSNNGVYFKMLKEGTGPNVQLTDTLVVNYKGSLLNGAVFDQSKDKPATFPLKRLIKGWQAVMPYCKQGGKIRMIIPSSMAYSIRNLGIIPPNSILVFDVEVLEIKPLR